MRQLTTALFVLCHNCGNQVDFRRPGDILVPADDGINGAFELYFTKRGVVLAFSAGQPMAQMALHSLHNLQQMAFEHRTDMQHASTRASASRQWAFPHDQPSTSRVAYSGYQVG